MGHISRLRAAWNNGKRWKILGISAVVILTLVYSSFFAWYINHNNQSVPLKPWEPLSMPFPPAIGCKNVDVPGACITATPVSTYPTSDPAVTVMQNYPVIHVPLGGPFPDFTLKSQRDTTEPINTSYDVWTQLVTPVDGAYDHQTGEFELPKGISGYGPPHSIGPQQQERIKSLYAQGIPVTVWQINFTQTPLNPPAGFYAVTLHGASENYAVVYGS